jgi:copper transport protein
VAALCLTTVVLARSGQGAAARSAALAFGELAVVSVALLAITGIAVLGVHVRTLHDLVDTAYGRTLLVKSGLFVLAGLLGLATALRLRLTRAPARTWVPRLEALVLVALLLPAALLTAQPPARGGGVTTAVAAPRTDTASSTVRDLVVSVAVEPERPGPNFVTVRVYNTRRPAPAPIRSVSLTLDGRSLAVTRAAETQWRAVTMLRRGAARIGVVVQRAGLADTAAATSWKVTPAPAPSTRTRPRALELILRPVAIGGAAALLALLLVRLLRTLRGSIPSGGLRPGKVER